MERKTVKITITPTGHAERLLGGLCELSGTAPEDFPFDGVAGALNAFNYRRVDSRAPMTRLPGAKQEPFGPELIPGETERARRIARLALETATASPEADKARGPLRSPWPEGLGERQGERR